MNCPGMSENRKNYFPARNQHVLIAKISSRKNFVPHGMSLITVLTSQQFVSLLFVYLHRTFPKFSAPERSTFKRSRKR